MQNVFAILDEAQSEWANDDAGGEIAEDRSKSQFPADWYRDQGGNEVNNGFL
jgi:hypothetical protein